MNMNTGGPAFAHGDPTHGGDSGMTLRDYFAASALAGLIKAVSSDSDMIASAAYIIADAMLAERNNTVAVK